MSKVILITGASTGFGRYTVETLAAEGHRVFASMRDINGKNREHAGAIKAKGIEVVELDVTETQSVEQAVASVVNKAGRIDVLINNAGVASAGVSEAFTDTQVTALFDVNVIGLHRVTRAVLPIFRRKRSGLIINIGSILGRVTFPFFGIYGASKFAVEAITDSLRYETSQFGIDVALVQPSAYPTQMYSSAAQPHDTVKIEEYGDVGEIPGAMFESFMSMFEGADAPNPHDIAEAVATLIETPAGQRPTRTVVGASFGADTINNAIEPVQASSVKALSLDHLEILKTV
ncbi:SDR family oxidoreductase [Kordiimonas aquimaris]|uniref:SDR family oxidoreductase n=1 Tax=Kordiimonas aquimaris TaxID=707591 RepID=UPI0021CF65A6|nr:SDR family oxidoreductase [Kordiimonas aquimaris]